MKIKTSELTGLALDYAVALASGATEIRSDDIRWFFTLHGDTYVLSNGWGGMSYQPSDNWTLGGPIIERGRICIDIGHDGVCLAYSKQNYADNKEFMCAGPTPLVATMRCFVASKLGEEVELPEKLK